MLPIALVAAALAALAALALGAGSSSVEAAKSKRKPVFNVKRSPDLWATINVCDTEANPDTVGVRGSMPGLRRRRPTQLWMRFRIQYLDEADDRWRPVTENADSRWKLIGRARGRVLESGQNFTFLPPPQGGRHRLRGVVAFKWVRRGRAVKRARRVTEAGHRSTAGADPEGYSAAVCDVT